MPLSKWGPGSDYGSRDEGSGKSPLIADMPTPTTPVTPSKMQPEVMTLSQAEDKKKKEDLFSCNRKPQKQFLFRLQTIRKKKWLKSFSTIGRKLPQTGTKESGLFAWLGLLGLGFLGGGPKFARRKE